MNPKPIDFVIGAERDRAVRALSEYLTSYTGRHFETFAALSPSNSFAPQDIVAVEMLSVRVPANTTFRLCIERAGAVADLLNEEVLPAGIELWDPALDLTKTGPLWRLWDLIAECGLGGSVVRSKLLSAKRPHAVPIYDQHVAAALGASSRDYWTYWRSQFSGGHGPALREAVRSVVDDIEHGSRLSVLRILDIVIWMRQHGYRSADNWKERFDDFLEPVRVSE